MASVVLSTDTPRGMVSGYRDIRTTSLPWGTLSWTVGAMMYPSCVPVMMPAQGNLASAFNITETALGSGEE